MLMRISLAKISGTTQIGFFSPILKNFFPFCLKDTTDEGEDNQRYRFYQHNQTTTKQTLMKAKKKKKKNVRGLHMGEN